MALSDLELNYISTSPNTLIRKDVRLQHAQNYRDNILTAYADGSLAHTDVQQLDEHD